jgi:glycosyltransferase involved in cell wall biosynthesis
LKPLRVVVVSNALDDRTRVERGISSDSPAASRKVFQLCAALRLAGVRPCVLSLGRGRADGSPQWHRRRVRRVDGIPVIYAPFSRRRGLSELVSLLAPAALLPRLRRPGPQAVLFYNREPAYLPSLLAARLLGFNTLFDLEDGEVGRDAQWWRGLFSRAVRQLYDRLCAGGALLACSALSAMTTVRPVHCYYGVAERSGSSVRWGTPELSVLLGGTLAPETGADLLVAAIASLRRTRPAWAQQLRIEISGKGPSLAAFSALAASSEAPAVTVHGRLSDAGYRELLARCELGLALKPGRGALADTTFPSKVVEMASAGMLVLSTDISDVRAVLGAGALYLERDDPAALCELLRQAAGDRVAARAIADEGARAVWARCEPEAAGRAVADFIFEARR